MKVETMMREVVAEIRNRLDDTGEIGVQCGKLAELQQQLGWTGFEIPRRLAQAAHMAAIAAAEMTFEEDPDGEAGLAAVALAKLACDLTDTMLS